MNLKFLQSFSANLVQAKVYDENVWKKIFSEAIRIAEADPL
jgi:hypothetical protein